MDIDPEGDLSDLESEEDTGSEDESEDEIRGNLEFDFGQVLLNPDEDEEIEENGNERHGCI